MNRTLLAAAAGGLIVFFWSALSHMVLPIGTMGLDSLPNDAALMPALSSSLPGAGLYFYPGMDMSRTLTEEEEAAWEQRYRTGPTGLILYHPVGGEPMTAGHLVTEFLSNAAAAAVAAILLGMMVASYGKRVLAVTLLGVFGWLSLSISYWNWYGFPTAFIAAEGIDQTVGWLLAGLAIAKIIPQAVRSTA